MGKFLIALLALSSWLAPGVASSTSTRSVQALPLASLAEPSQEALKSKVTPVAGQCVVRIARTGSSGSFEVAGERLKNGSCVCNVVTGPSGANAEAEALVSNILEERKCSVVADAAGAASSGSTNFLPAGIGGLLVAGGVGAAVAINDSAG